MHSTVVTAALFGLGIATHGDGNHPSVLSNGDDLTQFARRGHTSFLCSQNAAAGVINVDVLGFSRERATTRGRSAGLLPSLQRLPPAYEEARANRCPV